jgi:hypothetical protein
MRLGVQLNNYCNCWLIRSLPGLFLSMRIVLLKMEIYIKFEEENLTGIRVGNICGRASGIS